MQTLKRNLILSFGIVLSIILFGMIATMNDSKGISKGILYFSGSLIFSLTGIIMTILIGIRKIKAENVVFLSSMIANLFYILIFIQQVDFTTDPINWIAILAIPIIVGIGQFIALILKYYFTKQGAKLKAQEK